MKKNKEELIEHYSYYYSDSIGFVRDNLDNYIEMDHILKSIFKNINEMKKDYEISLNESGIYFVNKKTKDSYSVRIEF